MGRGRDTVARLSVAVLAVSAALAIALPLPAASARTAKAADSFVDSIGVNVHLGYDDTPYYEQFPAIEQKLVELGVRHVRDGISPGRDDQYAALNELAAAGVGSTLILGDPSDDPGDLDELISIVKTELPAAVEAIEGPNEYSTSGSSEWKSELVAYQERLYADVKEDPALAALPVIGPSIVHGDQEELGDVSAHLDFGNVHSYPEGNGPEYKMGSTLERAEINSGTKPIVATETGYTTALGWTPSGAGENRPVSEQAMATYVPRLFFEYFSRRIVRTFSYELIDENPDPDLDEREDHFGLLRNDVSEKPAFGALRNTIEVLADPGPAFAPGSLDYTLTGDTADLHQALLQKRDGTFYLVLWRISSIWDPVAKEALAAPSEPVTLRPEAGIEATALYDPAFSAAPEASFARSAEPTVEVGPGVAIVALSPAAPGPAQALPMAFTPPEDGFVAHCVVPDLRRKPLKAGRKRLGRARCRLGKIRGSRARTSRVKKQSPTPGTVLAAGARVSVKLG